MSVCPLVATGGTVRFQLQPFLSFCFPSCRCGAAGFTPSVWTTTPPTETPPATTSRCLAATARGATRWVERLSSSSPEREVRTRRVAFLSGISRVHWESCRIPTGCQSTFPLIWGADSRWIIQWENITCAAICSFLSRSVLTNVNQRNYTTHNAVVLPLLLACHFFQFFSNLFSLLHKKVSRLRSSRAAQLTEFQSRLI